jgi:hypothetical protein
MLELLLAGAASLAIVLQDHTQLRAAPKASGQQQALLSQGEALEVRGERLDFLQVYDYRRERGGFVRASLVKRLTLTPDQAPELLAVVRFLRDTSGQESLGIAYAAAFIQAAPAETLKGPEGIEVLDALGSMADRLAQRAFSQGKSVTHLEIAARHGLKFVSHEQDGRVHVCYDGDAFRRVLAAKSAPDQRARAVLGLTRRECTPGALQPGERRRVDEWRAQALDQVDTDALPAYLRNRIVIRRAAVWSSLAYQRARAGDSPGNAAARALIELGRVDKAHLTEEDSATFSDAAMRVNASRWALATAKPPAPSETRPGILTVPLVTGETCVLLVDAKHGEKNPLTKRCTFGMVWQGSASVNREGTAVALSVQPTDSWLEMWVFHKTNAGWSVRVLPPAAIHPEVGYAEFAGWVPGGSQILVAREAQGEGRYRRNFEIVRLDTLATVRQAGDPSMLGAFQRWQDPAWKRNTVSVR